MTTTGYALFDASDYLDSEEMIAEYLTAAAEDENPDMMLLAIANVAKARGMTSIAKAAGLSRESLYKALAPGAHPRFETIRAVLRALNVGIRIENAPPADPLSRLGELVEATHKTIDIAAFVRPDEQPAKRAATRAPAKSVREARDETAKPAPSAKKRA